MSLFEKELLKRLNSYKADGLIDAQSESNLRGFLETKIDKSAQSLKNALYILGIVLIFAAASLFVYHNWANLNERVKEFLAFVPLFISAIIGLYALKRNLHQFWKETAGLLNVLGIAVMISTIGVIYQLQPDTPHFCLSVICLGALAIPLFKSGAAIAAATYFNFLFVETCTQSEFIVGVVIYALLLFTAYKFSKSGGIFRTLTLFFVCFAFAISISINASHSMAGNILFAAFVGIYLCIASSKKYSDTSLLKNAFSIAGFIGAIWLAGVIGSRYAVESLIRESSNAIQPFYPTLWTLVAFYIFSLFFAIRNPRRTNALILMSAIFPAVAAALVFNSFWLSTILINGVFFISGIMIFSRGVKLKSAIFSNIGIIMILYQCVCRICDSQTDVGARSIAFATAGLLLIIFNVILNRRNSNAR